MRTGHSRRYNASLDNRVAPLFKGIRQGGQRSEDSLRTHRLRTLLANWHLKDTRVVLRITSWWWRKLHPATVMQSWLGKGYETLRQIIREDPGLLQINTEPAGASPTLGKSAAFTNPLTKIVASQGVLIEVGCDGPRWLVVGVWVQASLLAVVISGEHLRAMCCVSIIQMLLLLPLKGRSPVYASQYSTGRWSPGAQAKPCKWERRSQREEPSPQPHSSSVKVFHTRKVDGQDTKGWFCGHGRTIARQYWGGQETQQGRRYWSFQRATVPESAGGSRHSELGSMLQHLYLHCGATAPRENLTAAGLSNNIAAWSQALQREWLADLWHDVLPAGCQQPHSWLVKTEQLFVCS